MQEFEKGQVKEDDLTDMLNEVDLNKNGQVELDEFLQVRILSRKTLMWSGHVQTFQVAGPFLCFQMMMQACV